MNLGCGVRGELEFIIWAEGIGYLGVNLCKMCGE